MSRIYLSPPDLDGDERELLLAALDANWVAPAGPDLDAFEREFATLVGSPGAVAVSSGTAALHLALLVLGVGAGDEVVVPTLTFAASANAVRYVGATPLFADAEPHTGNVDPAVLEDLLEQRTAQGRPPAAVMTVDVYGQCCDYDRIAPLCRRFGVPIVEDAAEALGATWRGRPAGSFGTIAAFSFNGNKIITTSGGGMLVSDDLALLDRARYLATQARQPVTHYEHTEVGFNYRLSNLLAAIGRGQLARLQHKIRVRTAIRERYAAFARETPGIELLEWDGRGTPNAWLTVARLEPRAFGADRDGVIEHLERLDIEARPSWKPMHLQPVFRRFPTWGGTVAADLFDHGVCLPSGSGMTATDQERVLDGLRDVRERPPPPA